MSARIKKISLYILSLFLLFFLFSSGKINAQECKGGSKEDCAKLIEELENKLKGIAEEKDTLTSQINYMDTQIDLTQLRIGQTEESIVEKEEEIDNLSNKIDGLDKSLDYLSVVLLNKIVDSYKRRRATFLDILFDSDHATSLATRLKYIQQAQETDRKVLFQMQRTKVNFQEQKELREIKKAQLDAEKDKLSSQKSNLDGQKMAKQRLLADTKNSEKTYQQLLARARAEYAAIQGIVSGAGNEAKIKDVSSGETIASVIPGVSCNSSGSHLHFIVQVSGSVVSPFSYLKPVDFQDCSGSSCGSGDGDAFNPSGSWDWPVSPTIKFTQGFGSTWAIRNTYIGRIYQSHNGIDIDGSSSSVRAVADGELYKGSYSVGCALPYMKLVHKDSDIVTYYLHVY